MTQDDTARPDVLLLVNNGVDRDELRAATDRLSELVTMETVVTSGVADCRAALKDVDGRRVVVAGGDGTLTGIVALLRGQGGLGAATLGLLPLGTGNDFARCLGIPLDPRAAADVAAGAHVQRFDILVDDGDGVVVNAVHAGIGAEAAEAGEPYKDVLGAVAYPVGAAIAGGRFEPTRTTVSVDGREVFDGTLLMVAVGNGCSIGGGTPVLPDARPDDGTLDVMVVTADTLREKVTFAAALRMGTHVTHDNVVRFHGQRVDLRGDPLRHNADGEVSEPRSHASYRVEADAFTMAVPPPAGSASAESAPAGSASSNTER